MLWVRVDPEYQWIRQLTMEQSDTIWHCLLKYERDANAQLDAVEALETFQTNQTRDVFRDTILNSNFYYRVREQAAKSLSKVSDPYIALFTGMHILVVLDLLSVVGNLCTYLYKCTFTIGIHV